MTLAKKIAAVWLVALLLTGLAAAIKADPSATGAVVLALMLAFSVCVALLVLTDDGL